MPARGQAPAISLGNSRGARFAPTGTMANDALRARILALHERSFELACGVIGAYPKGPYLDDPTRIVWRQLVRAATSSTFNLEEADAASSDADFLAKMRIALRETREATKAIRIIVRCKLGGYQAVGRYEDESRQMAAIFGKIIVNKKAGMARRTS